MIAEDTNEGGERADDHHARRDGDRYGSGDGLYGLRPIDVGEKGRSGLDDLLHGNIPSVVC